MELALRREFGIPYALPLNRWGMQGLGDTTTCDAYGDCSVSSSPDTPIPAVGATGGSSYSQLIAQGVSPADAYQYDPAGAAAAGVDPSTLFAITSPTMSTPTAPATPAESAAASAWLLQNVPATATTAQALSTLALTAAQIASGLTAGAVQAVPVGTCPSGYRYASGTCVPSVTAASVIPGISNSSLMIGVVIFAAVMLMSGKRR
jgi:hypothetical protein